MVSFGRPAPPVPLACANNAPPRRAASTAIEPSTFSQKLPTDLIIPPPFKRFCIYGFAAQVVLDIMVVLVVRLMNGAFFTIPVACVCLVLDFSMCVWTYRACPRPIDVLMKNALSGVAWFMLAVINGAVIADSKSPYPFVMCLITFIVNAAFWSWTVWWGLNDRGPRSMYPATGSGRAKRCASCRAGTRFFSTRQPCRAVQMETFRPAKTEAGPVRGMPDLRRKEEEHEGLGRHPSFASSCFTEGAQTDDRKSGAASPV